LTVELFFVQFSVGFKGLELSSPHRCTLALNSLVEISERRINGQGLSRLRTADGRGYLSEQLNPLSGARGPVVELVPLPVALTFQVMIDEGAVVRQTRELTSPSDRTIGFGEYFDVSYCSSRTTHKRERERFFFKMCQKYVIC
jgi:hypothetical protein